jgi:hypothetical protein
MAHCAYYIFSPPAKLCALFLAALILDLLIQCSWRRLISFEKLAVCVKNTKSISHSFIQKYWQNDNIPTWRVSIKLLFCMAISQLHWPWPNVSSLGLLSSMTFYEQALPVIQKQGMDTKHIKLANQTFLFPVLVNQYHWPNVRGQSSTVKFMNESNATSCVSISQWKQVTINGVKSSTTRSS